MTLHLQGCKCISTPRLGCFERRPKGHHSSLNLQDCLQHSNSRSPHKITYGIAQFAPVTYPCWSRAEGGSLTVNLAPLLMLTSSPEKHPTHPGLGSPKGRNKIKRNIAYPPPTPTNHRFWSGGAQLRRSVFDGLAVYTRSTLAEQSTPASAPVSDTAAAVAPWLRFFNGKGLQSFLFLFGWF